MTMSCTEQVTFTCKTVFTGIHSLKRYAFALPFSVKVMLLKTLVLPLFKYCDILINTMTDKVSDNL